jgi:ankyrin repeat protein
MRAPSAAQGDDLGRNCAALTVAAEDGELEIVEALLAAGADPDGGVKETGERDCQDTPLVAALRNGHTEVAEMLVDAGANVACVCQVCLRARTCFG